MPFDPAYIVASVLAAIVLLLLVLSMFYNVSGTWERVPSHEEQQALERAGLPLPQDRLSLGQFGPFVTGRRDLPGGYQAFGGFALLGRVSLSRRDYGLRALMQQGFPEAIAKSLDGEITAKMQLRLVLAGEILDGYFIPFKVEFTHRPAKITGIHPLQAQRRRYRRLSAEELAEDTQPAFATS